MPGLPAAALFLLCLTLAPAAFGDDEIAATPNRPSVANPANVTQRGVLELEYGWERGSRSSDFKSLTAAVGLLKFGLAQDLELRLGTESYVSEISRDREGQRSGVGDTFPGFKYRLLRESGDWPALSVSYEVKVPTASRRKGLGSGRVDHSLTFLASKGELLGLDWDFNYQVAWIGEEGKKGFDHSHLLALALSRPLLGPLGISGEIYGSPRVNRQTPAIASTDWALTYALSPRVILDAGVDIGLNAAAADITYFAGITVALFDLYRYLRWKD